jgi:hypothetical protein
MNLPILQVKVFLSEEGRFVFMVKKKKVEELIDKIDWDQFNGATGFLIYEKINKEITYKVEAISCIIDSGILIMEDPTFNLNSGFLINNIENIDFADCYKINFNSGKSISITTLY